MQATAVCVTAPGRNSAISVTHHTSFAARTQPWSSGQAKGGIDRIEPLERQSYGRASSDLLRHRVLMPA